MAPAQALAKEGGCPPYDDETGFWLAPAPGIMERRTAMQQYAEWTMSLELLTHLQQCQHAVNRAGCYSVDWIGGGALPAAL